MPPPLFTAATLRCLFFVLLAGCAGALSPAASAQSGLRTQAAPRSVAGLDIADPARFGLHEDAFVLGHRMRHAGWTGPDETALRARYSFKYSLCGSRLVLGTPAIAAGTAPDEREQHSLCTMLRLPSALELFIAYDGEFDFYRGTRPSGPVINRLSAPGFYMRWPLDAKQDVELGLVHRSNGQVQEANSARGQELAQRAYATGDHRYFDALSRSANYWSVLYTRRQDDTPDALTLSARLRLYTGREESHITWGPQALARDFADHDRLELRAVKHLGQHHRFNLQWRIGDKGLAADSLTLGWRASLWALPLYLHLHRGPMNTLSNYAQRQDSVGLGLLFESP